MQFTELKNINDKMSDFDFSKLKNEKLKVVDTEKLWREQSTVKYIFLPKNNNEFGRLNTLSNKEQNNLIKQQRIQIDTKYFINFKI